MNPFSLVAQTYTGIGIGNLLGGTNINTGTATATVGASTSGGLTKNGAGTLTLSSTTSTFAGNISISDGTLLAGAGPNTLNSTTGSLGNPTLPSYTLTTSTGIIGTPTLDSPISGYILTVDGTSLKLVQNVDGYSTWAAINAPGSALGLDYDGDGVTNAVEYVLGGTKDTNDLAKLPAVSTSGGNLVFTFQRAQSSIDGTTTVAIQVGTTLLTWPDSYSVPGTALANNPGVTVVKDTSPGFDTVTLSVVQAPDAAKFARHVVTPAP